MEHAYVHGGVSDSPKPPLSLRAAVIAGLRAASALDGVEAAVRALEDQPELNAGLGAVVDTTGALELDAGIVDGATGRSGAVANVWVRHPISLARRVMEQTPHLLLAGNGAMALAGDMELLEHTTREQPERLTDTVGAVALDARGRLAAGSSTGGVSGKMPGRIGDSPVFGAGFYASPEAAIVGTGIGELFMATLACFTTGRAIEGGTEPQAACEDGMGRLGATGLREQERSVAGLLALDRRGRVGCAYRGASWAVEGPDGPLDARRLE